jgi:hypothetical protein
MASTSTDDPLFAWPRNPDRRGLAAAGLSAPIDRKDWERAARSGVERPEFRDTGQLKGNGDLLRRPRRP